MDDEGDLRILGSRDGLVHALIKVRQHIGAIDNQYNKIDPRHVRKRAARDAVTHPLKEVAQYLDQAQKDCQAAYKKSCGPKPPVDYRHYYVPDKRFPWFCGHCGYAKDEALKHFQESEMVKPAAAATS